MTSKSKRNVARSDAATLLSRERNDVPPRRTGEGSPSCSLVHLFHHFAKLASHFAGHPVAFCLAVGVVIIWAICGPLFHYSDTWQLVINTSTTIITFLMVFLIQSTQNRDITATQVKLDELIRALDTARNSMLDLEELEEEDLEKLHQTYEELARNARDRKGNAASHDRPAD